MFSIFHPQHNLPGWERVLRLCLGVLMPAAAVFLGAAGMALWLAVAAGAMMALTGVAGFCPACAMFGRRPVRPAQPVRPVRQAP